MPHGIVDGHIGHNSNDVELKTDWQAGTGSAAASSATGSSPRHDPRTHQLGADLCPWTRKARSTFAIFWLIDWPRYK